MKTDPAVQRRLLELSDVDGELAKITHRRKTLPETDQLADAEKELRAAKDALVAVETTASDLDRDVRKQEREVESVRAREDRDRKLMESGSVSAKQLADLEHELETLTRRQAVLEDDLLEVMERAEAVEQDQQHSRTAVDEGQQKVDDLRERQAEAFKDLDTAEARRTAEREELVAVFPAPLLELYERVRASRGRGAGLLQYRRCGACQLELDQSAYSEIKKAAPDDVVTCDNCGAILVRTEESGL